MLAALTVILLAVAIVAATFVWLGRQGGDTAPGVPELIRADPHPYKIKPSNPGGLDVAGDSETAFATSAGEDSDARLDTSKSSAALAPPPETNQVTAAAEPQKLPPKPVKVPAAKGPAEPVAAARGTVIQVGAYGSTLKADTAWTMLASRFPSVAALSKSVVTAQVGGKTVVRLRAVAASPADADTACAALRAGGENCLPVN